MKHHGVERRYRTVFLSDTHLGTRGSKAEMLGEFIDSCDADTIYLVGDIIDLWRMKRSWYWPDSHNEIIQKLLHKARNDTRIVYVPGNHDEILRGFVGTHFGGIEILSDAVHVTADGQRLLVIHGDAFDTVVIYAKWLALLGDTAYSAMLVVNHHFNVIRRLLGFPYWSLSAYLKLKVKNAVEFIGDFETAISEEARRRKVDGVVCGHIHHAEIRTIGDVLYLNTGDWVESCTACVEHRDGRMELIRWAEESARPTLGLVPTDTGYRSRKVA